MTAKHTNNRTHHIYPVCISLFAASQLLLASCAVGSVPVLAFLTWNASSQDVLTAGYNSIEIVESGSFPDSASPGAAVSSDNTVAVRNTGTVPCFVRLKVIISNDRLAEHITYEGMNSGVWSSEKVGTAHYDPDTDDRLYGYYYYTRLLEPGSVSEPLLTGLSMDSGTDEEMLMNFGIDLYAESIQAGAAQAWQEAWEDLS